MKSELLKEKIIEKIKEIYDPEIPVNIYDLGLIYSIDCETKDNATVCTITMTLTSAACPVSEELYEKISDIGYLLDTKEDIETLPHLVFDPPWSRDMMSEDARLVLEML